MLLRSVATWSAMFLPAFATFAVAADSTFFAPFTPARPVVETLHGVTLTDRYRWLEDGKDAQVQAWTRAQQAATLNYLDRAAPAIPGLKDELDSLYRPRSHRRAVLQARARIFPAHGQR